ncbi:MAG: hypothetical protein IT299_02585 [Dehalococcoidia bacterium]|nr:hypothetical protein [Dehalococcoidia bacterium]
MSGVLALVSLDGRPVPRELAQAQIDAIRHRGAGEPTLWLGEGVALGQAFRPTTPEAEREILPLVDPTGRYHLVWDGRIDNREELARAFGWKGERAREATDADHVLEAYMRWGDACVTRLLGDWAIVIWDATARRLFAAKDPMGFRTLFYAEHDGLFAIGSEPLQVLQPSWLPPQPDYDYALRLIGDAVFVPSSTPYQHLRELRGGENCFVADGDVRTTRFWSAPRVSDTGCSTPADYVEAFIAAFDLAVRARVRSRGPVGVFFSGGLDSSYLLARASEFAPVTAVSTYAEDTRWDERDYQRIVVEHLGVPYESIGVKECWALSSSHLRDEHFDGPQIPPQAPMQLAQAKFAASLGMRTMLTGDGGDEWLQGNGSAVADALVDHRLRETWRLAGLQGRRHRAAVVAHEAYRWLVPSGPKRKLRHATGRWNPSGFAPAARPRADWVSIVSAPTIWSRQHSRAYEWRYVERFLPLLAWRDRWCIQANGMTYATPFYDLRLLELLASTPDWVKQYAGTTKYPLRQALLRVLPSEIANRTDKGRYDDVFHRGLLEERVRVDRARSRVRTMPGVIPEQADAEIDRYIADRHPYGWQSWRLLNAGLWLDTIWGSAAGGAQRTEAVLHSL